MVSFGSSANSRTGMVVPVMRLCMTAPRLIDSFLRDLVQIAKGFEYIKCASALRNIAGRTINQLRLE
jgi:hypothetical protein